MPATTVVEDLKVEEEVTLGLGTGEILTLIDSFAFHSSDQAFHGRVVVPGTDAVHANPYPSARQQGLVALVRVLATLIGMMDEPLFRAATINGHSQGSLCQVAGHPVIVRQLVQNRGE